MRLTRWCVGLVAGAGLALAVAPAASAQTASAPAAQPFLTSFSVPTDVAAFYKTFGQKLLWFRDGGSNDAAIAQLVTILQRAPFDGFAEGPQLAAKVQAAVAEARANPAARLGADETLSTAWVHYVQALKKTTPGMIYAYPVLKPHGTGAQTVLLTAAGAPSLEQYLKTTSSLNPIYGPLRDAAWAEAQASGNMTPDPRLLANLDRARSIPASGKFLLVDSGSQKLTLFENGQPVDSMKVIVGTEQLPTPLIASFIFYVTYNPYWHAPDHLVRKTIAPTVLRQGFGYLKSHGYHVIDEWSENPTTIDPATIDWKAAAAGKTHLLVQQDPGPLNSMGKLKFPFANSEDIYLHDTPSKDLFAKDVRFLSNGCVRVEDAARLGRWLLGHDPEAPSADPELRVQIPQPVPIVLTYLTAEVTDGKLAYRPDVYGWDATPPTQVAAAN